MRTRRIDGTVYIEAGYRFKRDNADELRNKLQRRGQIVEIVEDKRSGHGVRGKFENKDVFMVYTRSK